MLVLDSFDERELDRAGQGPRALQSGDHIVAVRRFKGYAHHGIYVGEELGVKYVIHFTPTAPGGLFAKSSSKRACQICGHQANIHLGVVKTCLDCFLLGERLQVMVHNGNSNPSDVVTRTAYQLLQNGFGQYELLRHNCEDFATLCKTGGKLSSPVPYTGPIFLVRGRDIIYM
ncbi:hypothetical protein JCGZ_23519 [Jatropha curcas]|uniref:LRAT domain-containing protein n=1 Tax=Jatropha curcas TaxID=180498 RepID=A0A067JIA5_JATCU|nr:hypothetical protein JCGZ_23519 [Jatropha curcas]